MNVNGCSILSVMSKWDLSKVLFLGSPTLVRKLFVSSKKAQGKLKR